MCGAVKFKQEATVMEDAVRYLLADQRHDADAGEDVLAGQSLSRDAVSKSLCSVCTWLTQVPHEEGHIGPDRHTHTHTHTQTHRHTHTHTHTQANIGTHIHTEHFN